MGGALAVFHRLHRQVAPAQPAVATGVQAGYAGAAVVVGDDASVLQRQAEVGQQRGVELLADGLEHHVGGQRLVQAGGLQPPAHQRLPRKAHGHRMVGGVSRAGQDRLGHQPVVDGDAVGLRPILLGARGAHSGRSAPVDHVHRFGAQQLALHRGVHRGHAAADHHHPAAYRQMLQRGRIGGLPQLGDEVHRIAHARQVLARHAQALRGGQAHGQVDGGMVAAQRLQLRGVFEPPAGLQRDAA